MSAMQAIQNTVVEGLTKAGYGNSIQIIDGQPYSSLASGYKIPMFGLGTWSGGQEEDKGMTYKAVKEAIKQGYRHIDCAYCYGNEGEVGDAITESIKEGTIKREDLFVTTKLWIEFMQPDAAKKVFQEQLDALQLKYLDCFMIHNPYTNNVGPPQHVDPPHEVTWKALEDLVDAGKVRSIGVSNFSQKKLENLKKHVKKPISIHQVEIHPLWPNTGIVEYCRKNNIHVTAYSPLGASSSDSQRSFKMVRALDQPIIKELADKYQRSTGNIALRWGLQQGLSVVPKSTNEKRIYDNAQCLTFELKDDDVKAITEKVQPKVRALRFTFMYRKPGPFPNYEAFWDEPDQLPEYLKATGQYDLWEDAMKKGDFI